MRVEIESTNQATGKTTAVVATFNERELAVEIFEALTQQKRPDGMGWDDAWREIETQLGVEQAEDVRRAANRAMQYFARQVNLAGRQLGDSVQ
jgi:hypothetical protein